MPVLSYAQAEKFLLSAQALQKDGHFVYTSGKHGDTYLNKDAIYPHTELVSKISRELARLCLDLDVEVVVGPVAGGVVLSQWVAFHLSQLGWQEVLSVYTDKRKHEGTFILKRGYNELAQGKRVLVVDDIINHGTSVSAVVDEVRRCGGEPVAVVCLCNRYSKMAEDFGVPKLYSFINFKLNIYEPSDCPLCKAGIPLSKGLGHA